MLTNCRVLVVEDNPIIALDLVAVLEEEHGSIVGLARSVAEALQLLPNIQLDCALLDINVGGENCLPIADVLADTGVPFAFVTGYADAIVPERHRDRPVISKPFVVPDVIRTVRALLPNDARADCEADASRDHACVSQISRQAGGVPQPCRNARIRVQAASELFSACGGWWSELKPYERETAPVVLDC